MARMKSGYHGDWAEEIDLPARGTYEWSNDSVLIALQDPQTARGAEGYLIMSREEWAEVCASIQREIEEYN